MLFTKCINLLLFSGLFCINLNAQFLEKIDEITGWYSKINDFNVNVSGDRYYLIYKGADSIRINGYRFNLEPRDSSRNLPYYYGRSYFAGISNGESPFLLRPGGEKSLLTDSSILIFTTITEDTLKLSDTTIINYSDGTGSNLLLREYDFFGKPICTKQWKSTYDCTAEVNSLENIYGSTIMVGEYAGHKDGFLLDSQFISFGSGNLSGFIARMNKDMNVQWLRSIGGFGYEINNMITVNGHFHILNVGASASSFINFCSDSLDNKAIFDLGTDFLYFVQLDTLGNCINKKTIDYDYGSTIPTGVESFRDNSYIVSGVYNPSYLGFDTFYLYNPNNDYTGFLVKVDDNLSTLKTFQLEGSKGTKWIQYLAIDRNDNIWFSGYSSSDTLNVGSFQLIKEPSESTFSFLAKLDPKFNVVCVYKLEGSISGLKLGEDGMMYLLIKPHFGKDVLYKITDLTNVIEKKQNTFEHDVKLYPNPAKDKLIVDWRTDLILENCEAEIIGINGIISHHLPIKIGQNFIDLTKLNNGVYLLRLSNEKGEYMLRRFLVNK